MPYIGKYAWKGSVRALFEGNTCEEWLEQMKTAYPRFSPFELSDAQQRAWGNCFDVLSRTFASLPNDYGRLKIVFEYVLPQHRPDRPAEEEDIGVRADVLLLCRETVIVLEFKDRDAPYPGCYRQARKYQRRLQQWHRQSDGMRKKTVAVFTKAHDMRLQEYRLVGCSPDHLAEVLADLLPSQFHTMERSKLTEWLASEWSVRENGR